MRWLRPSKISSLRLEQGFFFALSAIQFWPTGLPVGFFVNGQRQILPQTSRRA